MKTNASYANPPKNTCEKEYEVGTRPWGIYYILEDQPMFKVKKIIVNSGARISLQKHEHRSEHWVVLTGTATVEIHDPTASANLRTIMPGQSCYVPQGVKHRLSNKHPEPLVIIEVQMGTHTDEDDVVRYEDDYERT